MKKFFSNHLVQTILVQLVLTGGVFFFFQKSFENSLVEKRLKKEIFMKEKRDAYEKAIEIVYRQLAVMDYDKTMSGDTILPMKRNRGTSRLTELEMNTCLSKLYMYAGDIEILNSFTYLISNKKPPYTPLPYLKSMLNAMNKDLGNPEPKNEYDLMYIAADTTKR